MNFQHHTSHISIPWGRSSAGRAPALQAGGQRFDPARLHHSFNDLNGLLFLQKAVFDILDSVAQLDRAFDFESKGRRFESCRGRHFTMTH